MSVRHLKFFKYCSLALFVLLFLLDPSIAPAAPLPETYLQAIANAQTNINGVAGSNAFVPDFPARGNKAIITIQGTPALENPSFGITYNSNFGDGKNYLVVRTLTNVSFYLYGSGAQTGSIRYGTGAYTTFNDGANHQASWVTTGNDTTKFIDANVASPGTFVTTMEQGLGMDTALGGTHTAIVEYGVIPDNNNLIRPTNQLYINSYSTTNTDYTYHATFTPVQPPLADMSADVFAHAQTYLQYWQGASLGAGTFPWTELGYTYYWGHTGTTLTDVQGSSEFIILGGTAVKIIGIYSPESYMYTKNKNGAFSADLDAEYGNGFGSFNVTDNCDTIWAGNAFQKNASNDPNNPNQIVLAAGKTISGGQGILVWSPNYTVTNYGTISGATFNKLQDATAGKTNPGMTGTANIAMLFKGDTSYGDPSGKNILINSGSISSDIINASTAIEADAGNTEITNVNGGTISGYTYGIHFLNGTNRITNRGTISTTGGAADSAAIQIDAGTTVIDSTGGTINGNVVLASNAALDVGASTLNVNGKYTQNASSTLKVAIASPSSSGKIISNNSSTTVSAASNVNVTVPNSIFIPNNATFTVVDAPGAAGVSVPGAIASSDPRITFSGLSSNGDLILTASRATSGFSSLVVGSSASGAAAVLDNISNPSADMTTVLNALEGLNNSQAASALATVVPVVDSGVTTASNTAINQFIGTSTDRLGGLFAQARNEETGDTGVSTGSEGRNGFEAWGQGFGEYAHQDPRGTSNGYHATIWGTAIGGDIPLFNDRMRLGASGGYAQSDINSKDNSGATDINSYQTTLYAGYIDGANPYYINGAFSFAFNKYKGARNIAIGTIMRTADAHYNGQQYSVLVDGGYTFKVKSLHITPIASLQYLRLNLAGYTETGADALNLGVNRQHYNMLESGLGMKFERPFDTGNSTVIPEVHAKWLYDIINGTQATTSTFSGGGGSFATQGFNPARNALDLGAKLTLATKWNWSLETNYDFEYKEDFTSHTGWADIKYSF